MLGPKDLLTRHSGFVGAIRAMVGVPANHWQTLYQPMIDAYAGLVQQLPVSQAHHHAGPGGLLQHGLEVVHEALKLRRSTLLPTGAPAEEVDRHQDVWTYACVAAALLHALGKLALDQRITLYDLKDNRSGAWTPLIGPMPVGTSYRVDFINDRRYQRHSKIAPLLTHFVVPTTALQWLAEEPKVLDAWLACIQGDIDAAGPLGEIVSKADGLSVVRDLTGGSKVRQPSARTKPLAERLLTSLRKLLSLEELALNRSGAAAFLDGDTLWLVSEPALDAVREFMLQEGQLGIPSRNDRLMDELQQYALLVPNGERAIWTCVVRIGEWSQQLACLRMQASRLWSDPSRRPSSLNGSVTPVSADPPESENTHATEEPTGEVAPNAADYDDLELPAKPDASDTEPPTPAGAMAVEDDAGKRFLSWLTSSLHEGRARINTAQGKLHVLPEGLALVSPGIFRDFDAEHWQRVQKRFQKLGIHRKTPENTNVWRCQVVKDRKRSTISVILIPNPEQILGAALPPPSRAVSLISPKDDSFFEKT